MLVTIRIVNKNLTGVWVDAIHAMACFKSMVPKRLAKRLPRLAPAAPSLLHFPRRKRSEGRGKRSGARSVNEAARAQGTKGIAEKGI